MSGRRPGDINRRAAEAQLQRRRSMGLSSKCEQCHVYSRRTRLNTGLFELYFEFEEGIVRGHAPVVHKKRHSRL